MILSKCFLHLFNYILTFIKLKMYAVSDLIKHYREMEFNLKQNTVRMRLMARYFCNLRSPFPREANERLKRMTRPEMSLGKSMHRELAVTAVYLALNVYVGSKCIFRYFDIFSKTWSIFFFRTYVDRR